MAAIASRYARALVEVVLEKKIDPATAVQQVRDMVATVEGSNELRMVWESPAVPAEQQARSPGLRRWAVCSVEVRSAISSPCSSITVAFP